MELGYDLIRTSVRDFGATESPDPLNTRALQPIRAEAPDSSPSGLSAFSLSRNIPYQANSS